jgi:hypothetical protein
MDQISRAAVVPLKNTVSIGPVLTIEAVEGTGGEEYGQVPVSPFRSRTVGVPGIPCSRSPGANPVGDAVGGQGVVVPAGLGGILADACQLTAAVESEPADTHLAFTQEAVIGTHSARYATRGSGDLPGQAPLPAGFHVSLVCKLQSPRMALPQARPTGSDRESHDVFTVTEGAGGHKNSLMGKGESGKGRAVTRDSRKAVISDW